VARLRRDNEATASFFSEARVQVSISRFFSSSANRLRLATEQSQLCAVCNGGTTAEWVAEVSGVDNWRDATRFALPVWQGQTARDETLDRPCDTSETSCCSNYPMLYFIIVISATAVPVDTIIDLALSRSLSR